MSATASPVPKARAYRGQRPIAGEKKTSVRRQAIIDIAAEVFAEKGLLATTVRDISDRAGILSGSLYHHFASKEALISETLEPVVASQIDAIDRVVATTTDPVEILRAGIAAAVAQTAADPAVARILHQDEQHIRSLPGLEEVVRLRRAMRDRIEALIERGRSSGQFRADVDARVASMALFDVVLGAYRHLPPMGEHTIDEVTGQVTALVLGGLLSRP